MHAAATPGGSYGHEASSASSSGGELRSVWSSPRARNITAELSERGKIFAAKDLHTEFFGELSNVDRVFCREVPLWSSRGGELSNVDFSL